MIIWYPALQQQSDRRAVAGTSQRVAGFRKDGGIWVFCRDVIKRGSSGASGKQELWQAANRLIWKMQTPLQHR